MRTEVPICHRCCFCMPLRYGLLSWGYLNLIPSTFFLFINVYQMMFAVQLYFIFHWLELFVHAVGLLQCAVNFAFAFLLIVALHKRNSKWLKIYQTVSLVCALTNVLLSVLGFLMLMLGVWWLFAFFIYSRTLLSVPYIVMQLYMVALVRSEVIKLESSVKYQFSNLAATAENIYYGRYEPGTNTEKIVQEKKDNFYDQNDKIKHKTKDEEFHEANKEIEANKADMEVNSVLEDNDSNTAKDGDLNNDKTELYDSSETGEGKKKKKISMLKTPIRVMGKGMNYNKV